LRCSLRQGGLRNRCDIRPAAQLPPNLHAHDTS
jgi:hypothetical protein